jgi:dynein heavy chain
MGDLRDSALVLINYLEGPQSSSKIPWDDLRYIFGEIMYGGHITDDWDRILCLTYLDNLMDNPLLDETELFPFSDGTGASFKSPAPTDYSNYILHIDENFGYETPIAFGMHPNAEIGFRTNQCTILFNTLVDLQPNDETGEMEEGVKTRNEVIQDVVTLILEDMGIEGLRFDLEDIRGKFMEDDDKLCFINVFL